MDTKISRITLIVLDSVGIGALPDAARYGDEGSNTLAHIARYVGGLRLPHLGALGLGNILAIEGVPPAGKPKAAYGRMAEASAGKDTTTGHWEIAGLLLERPFPVYPHGFPPEIIKPFEERIGRPVLGNKPASGTAIIEELGAEHMRTGRPIVYTSADSVFQIAAHEEVIPLEELYRMCRIARALLTGEHAVGRVIARPFVGQPGSFQRTANRRDFSLPPPAPTVLDLLQEKGLAVLAVGKIEDIFAGRGITEALHTENNMDGVDKTLTFMRRDDRGLIFTNLVDFDMLYGHRNNPRGYAGALEDFDRRLPEILAALRDDEVLIITADHGCDPTTGSTDHSREYVPLLVYGRKVKAGWDLGTRRTFSDVAATVAELFGLSYPRGKSFAGEVCGQICACTI
ncbi:phosphopentomutase [Desulfofundulus thermobenzoicus]|uniref:Phosphopentomutase n=1 Tax=Desulfofundulus thermobenzoicus TaxID=29376 RepID=A0A6N7IRB9_9FIRM|nr:phosphopentomutase [Desulfofundulus thermobenzoicus]MQL52069.1 phosphopentomutase [Desulfofundulus thermobenzoicus]